MEVVALAGEVGMLDFFDDDDKIAGRPALPSGMAFPSKRKLHARVYTCWDGNLNGVFAQDSTFAFASWAWVSQNRPRAVAAWARCDVDKLPEHGTAHLADLPGPVATRAGRKTARSASGAASVAGAARQVALDADGFFYAACNFFEP